MIDLRQFIDADLREYADGIWQIAGHESLAYSDGVASERYIEHALSGACDLGSESEELESLIRDWPSEYHLGPKRARLLKGFRFDADAQVLEVGCGCGAVTRYLGETFGDVVAVEGSIVRARLARLRTRDQDNVAIVSAPLQALRVRARFDVIFCIGVLEYSAVYDVTSDPFDAALRRFAEWLKPDGVLVVAIENQFGLKYFNAAREDHLGARFEGLEGYCARRRSPRTFGKAELEKRIGRHFATADFFFPYPDYKVPSCVVSEQSLRDGGLAELVTRSPSRDYLPRQRRLWNESLVSSELARNGMVPFFANSFLVVASKSGVRRVEFPQEAIFYSADRKRKFLTSSRLLSDPDASHVVRKTLLSGSSSATDGPVTLKSIDCPWHSGESLHLRTLRRCRNLDLTLAEIFEECTKWLDLVKACAGSDGEESTVPGRFLDATWQNCMIVEGGELRLFDQEWHWNTDLPLNVLTVRAIYVFLRSLDDLRRLNPSLSVISGKRLIERIAVSMGQRLVDRDFAAFVRIESQFQAHVWGTSEAATVMELRAFLAGGWLPMRAKRKLREALDTLRRGRRFLIWSR